MFSPFMECAADRGRWSITKKIIINNYILIIIIKYLKRNILSQGMGEPALDKTTTEDISEEKQLTEKLKTERSLCHHWGRASLGGEASAKVTMEEEWAWHV